MVARMALRAHYIANSHLDREWTLDFQHSRALTVRFIDRLLEIMAKVPEYEFLLDAQTLPLEDYLEIRPERRARIEELVRAGRLHIGPWYSAPDMNTISGEAITRNLLMGHLTAERFGRVMKVGYTPFGFVHISQLPQIYAGFGIDTCFFYRGITARQAPRAEFIWEGADGTRVLASRMSAQPRYNYFLNVWRKSLYGDQPARLRRSYEWASGQLPFKICDEETRFDHGSILRGRRVLDAEAVRREIAALFEREEAAFRTPELAFMHGFDTSAPDILEDEVLRIARASLPEGRELLYSSMPRYAEALKKALEGVELPVLKGEMKYPEVRPSGFRQSFVNTVSTRMRQKILATKVENHLVRLAEPFATVAGLLGAERPSRYLDIAWRLLLQCHAHDTVGGCGIDRIEEDSTYRLNQAGSISRMLLKESLGHIQAQVDCSGLGPRDILVTLFNPSSFPRTEVVTFFLDVDRKLGLDSFVVEDSRGREVESDASPTGNRGKIYRDPDDMALHLDCDEHRVRVLARELPPLGYETFVVRKGRPRTKGPSLVRPPNAMENEHLRVEIAPDGTLCVFHKESRRRYEGLHVFEDVGEAGHPWMHIDVRRDIRVTSAGSGARVALLEDTPLVASYEVALRMDIPETHFDDEARYVSPGQEDSWRSGPTTPLDVRSVVSLAKPSRTVDIVTTVTNRSRNHRLRVLFPTGLRAEHTHADNPYDVIARPVRRGESHPLHGLRNIDYPFLKFVGLQDGPCGFAFVGLGLKEYEALDDDQGTLAVTLLRAVDPWLCTTDYFDKPPGSLAQCLGDTEFRYRLFFHSGDWLTSGLLEEGERLNYPVIPCQAGPEAGGTLPRRFSFLAIEGCGIVMSAFKMAERGDGVVVRVYNPSEAPARGTLRCFREVAEAAVANMNEEPLGAEDVRIEDGAVRLELPPKKVKTLLLRMRPGPEGNG